MEEIRLRRAQLQQLTERLITEYAATVPPGQVVAAVVRAQRQLRVGSSWSAQQAVQCEDLARRYLGRRISLALTPTG